ncbi:hypothetical protein ABK040_009151 [Willaertia magna]
MELKQNEAIQNLLQKAHQHIIKYGITAVEKSLQVQIEQFLKEESVTFEVLRKTIEYLNEQNKEKERIFFHEVIKGSELKLEKPKIKTTPKDPQWLKLTEKLKRKVEDDQYSQLVSNVTFKQRLEREKEPLNTYKTQLSVGIDLILTMFTLFVAFYYGSQYLFTGENKTQYQLLMGLLGLILGLLIDVTLIIIRSHKSETMAEKKLKGKNQATNAFGIETLPSSVKQKLFKKQQKNSKEE